MNAGDLMKLCAKKEIVLLNEKKSSSEHRSNEDF